MLFSALFRKNIQSYTDLELIVFVRKNNQNAIGELFKRYAALVMGLSLKYLKNQNLAEDILMEIFEKLPKRIQKHEIQNFKSWLYSLTRNECLMELRKKKNISGDIEKELLYQPDMSENEQLEKIHLENQLTELEQAIKTLKEDQKDALTHFYLEQKSYTEVSAVMGISLNAVKSLIQNGKRNLKLKLER